MEVNFLKKKLGLGLISTFMVVSLFFVSTMPAFASKGTWSSAFKYDINGITSVGTTNAYTAGGNFQLRVVYATGNHVGNKSYYLGVNKSASATFTGTIARDKQGWVLCSSQYYHSPWFEV